MHRRTSPFYGLIVLAFCGGCSAGAAEGNDEGSPDPPVVGAADPSRGSTGTDGAGPLADDCYDGTTELDLSVTDACEAPADVAATIGKSAGAAEALEKLAFFAARDCVDDGMPTADCAVSRIATQTACEASVECTTCYALYGACINEHCWGECSPPDCGEETSASDPTKTVARCPDLSPLCDSCRCGDNDALENCMILLDDCAGTLRGEEVCGAGSNGTESSADDSGDEEPVAGEAAGGGVSGVDAREAGGGAGLAGDGSSSSGSGFGMGSSADAHAP